MKDKDGNTGNQNSGNSNTGDWNAGNHNTGNQNSGNRNTGNRNSGHYNSGHWNAGNHNAGYFNSTNGPIHMFNKPLDMKNEDIKFPIWLYWLKVSSWVSWEDMTIEERNKYNCEVSGGYYKPIPYEEAWKNLWESLSDKERKEIKLLPNFDAKIFKEITGIDINDSDF